MDYGRVRNRILAGLLAWVWIFPSLARATGGTTGFLFDNNRMYAEVGFVRPDGSLIKTLAFVDLGSPQMLLSPALFGELKGGAQPVRMKLGALTVEVKAGETTSDRWLPFSLGENQKVEALLPAGVMKDYVVTIDYAKRALTLAQPGKVKPEGAMVPIRVDEKTGLAVVNVSVDGQEYPMTIDNGSAYTWIRKAVAGKWLAAHPEWERGQGAVGVSNMRMADDGMEAKGTVVRVSKMKLGTMMLSQVGALAVGPSNSHEDMMDWYSKKNVTPVIGWLGGNVLQGFRITIDYEKGMSYWEKQKEVDGHDLDEVGLTLESRKGDFFVAAVAVQNGKPTVEGVQPGDKLVRIGNQQTQGMPWSKVLSAMHGEPGERREILVERGGKRITVEARVSRF